MFLPLKMDRFVSLKITNKWQARLWPVLLLAITLRLGFAVYLGDKLDGPQQYRVQDQVSYNALARSLVAGRGYTFEQDWYPGFTPAHTPTAHWSFLYPLYLAGVYSLTGYHPIAARLLQSVVSGFLGTWLSYRLGRRLFGEVTGLLSATLYALYAYFIFHDAALMTESFFSLGVLAMLILALEISGVKDPVGKGEEVRSDDTPGRSSFSTWLCLGVVLGITSLLRQTILLWLPFLLLWLFWEGRRRTHWWGPAITCAVLTLFIMPWTVRNYMVYHEFLPLNSNAGYALYSANHPNHGIEFDQDYAAPLPPDLIVRGLNEAEWNSALTRRGLEFILQYPVRYLLLSLDRIPIFFNFWFHPESSLSSSLMRVLSYGLYLPFFLYGLFLSAKQRKRCSLIYLFGLVYSAMHILIWASIRYRLPVDAALMPFAALAIVDLARRIGIRFPRFSSLIRIHPSIN